jgi:hypothetical protein
MSNDDFSPLEKVRCSSCFDLMRENERLTKWQSEAARAMRDRDDADRALDAMIGENARLREALEKLGNAVVMGSHEDLRARLLEARAALDGKKE